MGRKNGKRYTPKFKFNVVLEELKSERADAEVDRYRGPVESAGA